MPRYIYAGEPDRYYPTLGITPEPGKTHDLEVDPGDGRWELEPTDTAVAPDDAPTATQEG